MIERKTIFSDDRKYRYTLWREWPINEVASDLRHRHAQFAQFIGLNPSTADETQDDPTIRRCVQFAKDWGFGALCMTNLFALRATDPQDMKAHPDPIGYDNDDWLESLSQHAGVIIAAWGKDGKHMHRGVRVKLRLNNPISCLHCLGLNSDGSPKHPLYLKKSATWIAFR